MFRDTTMLLVNSLCLYDGILDTYLVATANLTVTISQYSSHIQGQQLQHVAQKDLFTFNKIIGHPNKKQGCTKTKQKQTNTKLRITS